jgi:hypothetical protein
MGRDKAIFTTCVAVVVGGSMFVGGAGEGGDGGGGGGGGGAAVTGSIQHVGCRTMGSPVQGYILLQLVVLHDGRGTQHSVAKLETNDSSIIKPPLSFRKSSSGSWLQAMKPVFILERAASSIELITDAHVALPHVDGERVSDDEL